MPARADRLAPPPCPRAWALLLALGAIWGGSFVFVEIALREVPPLTLAAHRVTWAALALGLYLAWRKRLPTRAHLRLWPAWGVMGLLNNAVPFSLIIWGQTQIEAGLASIFNALTAVFGVLVAAMFIAEEPLTARKLAGAALGVAGVALIVGADALSGLDLRSLGQLAVVGATVSYAFASVWGRLRLSSAPPEANALGMLSASALLMLPIALAAEGAPRLDLTLETWAATLALAVAATSAAYLLYFDILARAGAANTMLVTVIVPPFAMGLGWLMLGETAQGPAVLGFAIVALGLAVSDGRLLAWLRRVRSARSAG